MPLTRFEKLDQTRRVRLLGAAAGEFASHGFEGASLQRIAEGAGVSKAAIYYYFDDKADLYAAVIAEAWKALVPRTPLDLDALDATSFWPVIRARYLEMVELSQQEPWLAAAGRLVYHPEPVAGVADVVAEEFGRARRFLERLLARGQALGVVREDLPSGLLLTVVTAAAEAADHWMVDHWESLPHEELGPLAFGIFDLLRGVVSPKAGGSQ